jgi:hypothetical protein
MLASSCSGCGSTPEEDLLDGEPIGTTDHDRRWEKVAGFLGEHISRYRPGVRFSYENGGFLLEGLHWTRVYMSSETKAEWRAWAAGLGLPDAFWHEFAEDFGGDQEDLFEGLERDEGPAEWALNKACEILGRDRSE